MSDWFKLQNDIAEDGHVQAIAAKLKVKLPLNARVTLAAGGCARLWAHFDKQTIDGFVAGMTREVVDMITGVDGFAVILEAVGWLEVTAEGVQIPDFEKHNGETAKQRALSAQRSARHRNGKPSRPEPGARHGTSVTNPERGRDAPRTESVRNPNQESESEQEQESEAFSGRGVLSRVAFSSPHGDPTQRDSTPPPDNDRLRRAELLAEMRRLEPDDHSLLFFQRVAIHCRIPTIERALSATRAQMAKEGINPGKWFTRVLIDESLLDGIDPRSAGASPGRPKRARAA